MKPLTTRTMTLLTLHYPRRPHLRHGFILSHIKPNSRRKIAFPFFTTCLKLSQNVSFARPQPPDFFKKRGSGTSARSAKWGVSQIFRPTGASLATALQSYVDAKGGGLGR